MFAYHIDFRPFGNNSFLVYSLTGGYLKTPVLWLF